MNDECLRTYVKLIAETLTESRTMREADVSDGNKVPYGSERHVQDLESRIADLTKWRDRQRRGSEARANYSRLITRLKSELRSAKALNQRDE